MAGFILGTGSGVLAAAAVYYTLSTSLSQSVASLRTDLSASSGLLDTSFNPQNPPAPSSLVGPSYPSQPRFSDTLRQRWNLAISKGLSGIQNTDVTATTAALITEGRELVDKLAKSEKVQQVEDKVVELGRSVKSAGEEIERKVEAQKDGDLKTLGVGVVGGDVRGESFTGGSGVVVRAKREEERREGKRLV